MTRPVFPLVTRLVLLVGFVIVIGLACKARSKGISSQKNSTPTQTPLVTDLASYSAACERELGPFPEIKCLEAEVIPMTNNSEEISEKILSTFNEGKSILSMKCDRPSLIGMDDKFGQCIPYSRFGSIRATAKKPVHWAFLCRRMYPRAMTNPHFDQIAAIGYNVKTGATCFFNGRQNMIPPDPKKGTDFAVDSRTLPLPSQDTTGKYWESFATVAVWACCHLSCRSSLLNVLPWSIS